MAASPRPQIFTDADIWLKSYCGHFDVKVISKLDLSGKGLSTLPNIISSFSNLKILDLSNNNLSDNCLAKISNKYLPNLEVLNLSKNANLKSIGKIVHIYQDKDEKPILKENMVRITDLDVSDTLVDYLPFLKNDEVFYRIFENLEKLKLENTPLNTSLVQGDENVMKLFNLKSFAWLNNEPIWSITHPNDRDRSFYVESRKIKYHLENGIPFEDMDVSASEKEKRKNEKRQKQIEDDTGDNYNMNMEISPRLKVRLDRYDKELTQKLNQLNNMLKVVEDN